MGGPQFTFVFDVLLSHNKYNAVAVTLYVMTYNNQTLAV